MNLIQLRHVRFVARPLDTKPILLARFGDLSLVGRSLVNNHNPALHISRFALNGSWSYHVKVHVIHHLVRKPAIILENVVLICASGFDELLHNRLFLGMQVSLESSSPAYSVGPRR